ncbi:hypothetical protein [Gordonia alkanivorans]|uniref:hypothetical protein n=1 Tax=Gordonia alkanivorans TaxID=84096 RepID=UPI0012DCC573|nr:hypothetical protein [Gordonia alkanivorans]
MPATDTDRAIVGAPATIRLRVGQGWDNATMTYLAHSLQRHNHWQIESLQAHALEDGHPLDMGPLVGLLRRGRIKEALATTDQMRGSATITSLSVIRHGVHLVVTRKGVCTVRPESADRVRAELGDLLRPRVSRQSAARAS